jgi:hypothetical protein
VFVSARSKGRRPLWCHLPGLFHPSTIHLDAGVRQHTTQRGNTTLSTRHRTRDCYLRLTRVCATLHLCWPRMAHARATLLGRGPALGFVPCSRQAMSVSCPPKAVFSGPKPRRPLLPPSLPRLQHWPRHPGRWRLHTRARKSPSSFRRSSSPRTATPGHTGRAICSTAPSTCSRCTRPVTTLPPARSLRPNQIHPACS